ncbi:MAG: DUF503 domain-containing protein [Chloroflexota bacterium]
MIVATARVVLHLPMSHSLKDKRQVMQSTLNQVRRRFGVSSAEIEEQERWQIGVIGLAHVSNSAAHSREVLETTIDFIAGWKPEGELLEQEIEIIQSL